MHYVLIIVLMTNYGTSVSQFEYKSVESCKIANDAFTDNMRMQHEESDRGFAVCVKDAEEGDINK